jgi:hypothetical protein
MRVSLSSILVSSFAATAACATAPPPVPDRPVVPACGSDAGSATQGWLSGVVTDKSDGTPLQGVTVIETSPSVPGSQTAITDKAGAYQVAVPPAIYLTTFYYADYTIERANVPVGAGCHTPVDMRIDTHAPNAGEQILIRGG